ncbi:MAG: hypothetical protein ACK5OX_04970 [Desertimonas sp.]
MGIEPSRRRLVVLAAVAGVVLVVLVGVGIYGLIAGPPDRSRPEPPATSGPPSPDPGLPSTTAGLLSWEDLPALPRTGDPIVYARAVTEALFTWDTMSGLLPVDYGRPIIADADPSGLETPGLVSDLANYLPTAEVWQQLRHYETAQSVTIDAAYIPDSWAAIAAGAGGQLRDGTVAVTLEATRHRAGVWFDRLSTSDHPVEFTVFVACEPTFDRCHTLRLSQIDNPLR